MFKNFCQILNKTDNLLIKSSKIELILFNNLKQKKINILSRVLPLGVIVIVIGQYSV
jgi:hypothetical protein